MSDQERRGWIIVGAICVSMFFIWGAINSSVIFFVPVLKNFGWSRAAFSSALSVGWITGGAAGPLIGWLADRVNPKRMIVVGTVVTGALWLVLSRATSLLDFSIINGIFGLSVGAATTIPCSLIIANWFDKQRGLAIGIAFAAAPLGGAVVTPTVNHIVTTMGWRAGYFALGLPILAIVTPLVLFIVRPRNASEGGSEQAAASQGAPPSTPVEIPGFELGQAAETRSFWVICAVQFLVGATVGMGAHYAAYLTGIGYSAAFAGYMWAVYQIMMGIGAFLGGRVADRAGARATMIATCFLSALGFVGLLGATSPLGIGLNVVAGGFALGAFGVEMPLVIIESLGVKRMGSLLGVTGIFYTAAVAGSQIGTGRVFDVTGSYAIAIVSFIAMLLVSAIALFGCRTYEPKDAEFTPATPTPTLDPVVPS